MDDQLDQGRRSAEGSAVMPEKRPRPDEEHVREALQEAEEEDADEREEPKTEELDQDPAYDPDDPELKRLKGG